MLKKLEVLGGKILGRFVPRVEAEAACGHPYVKYSPRCWQCSGHCGYWAPCRAICRSGCGCQVTNCYC
ncbi:hypothetical protein [Streptomyces sp. NPDC059788]|uniref:hypothetical protein n=1 Tax=Streptomyces sp. NPDC059788 TaxID=3346948 RepID=UPI003660E2C9